MDAELTPFQRSLALRKQKLGGREPVNIRAKKREVFTREAKKYRTLTREELDSLPIPDGFGNGSLVSIIAVETSYTCACGRGHTQVSPKLLLHFERTSPLGATEVVETQTGSYLPPSLPRYSRRIEDWCEVCPHCLPRQHNPGQVEMFPDSVKPYTLRGNATSRATVTLEDL